MNSVWAIVLVVSSVACTKRWKPADPSVLASTPGRTIGVVSSEPGTFVAHTPFGNGLGRFTELLEGRQILEKNHIADPSPLIASRLMMALSGRYSLTPRTPRPLSGSGDKVVWDTDLYLQVTTEVWGVDYFLNDWSRYRLGYEASVQLRDSRSGRVIASGQCQSHPEDATGAPTYDEMFASEAALLKQKLGAAATACTQMLAREIFAVRLPDDPIPDPVKVDRSKVYATCHLEETPAWKTAGPAERHQMLNECWNKRAPATPKVERVAPAEPIKY